MPWIESLDKCLGIGFSLLILGQAYLCRRVAGSWLLPAPIFGLFWFAYTFFPLVVLFTVPANPWAIAFILLCTLVFTAGSLPFHWPQAFAANASTPERSHALGSRFMRIAFTASSLTSLLFLIINTLKQDITLFDLVFNFFESSAKYIEMRYADEVTVNPFLQFGIVLTYVGSILGGFIYPSLGSRSTRWGVIALSFLPSVFVMTTQSSKGQLFLAVVLFYSALLIVRLRQGNTVLFGAKGLRTAAWLLALVVPMLVVSFLSRGLYDSGDDAFIRQRLIYYFASYSFGHLYAFSDWFSAMTGGISVNDYLPEEPQWGFYTFMSLFRLMGNDKVVPQGVFDEYFIYDDLLSSNIYTIFRGLVLDFGWLGTLSFMLATSLLLHLGFQRLLTQRRSMWPVCVFVFMMGYFYSSFIISVFMWNSFNVSFFLVWLTLWVNGRSGRVNSSALRLGA